MRVNISNKLLVAVFYVLIACGAIFLFPKTTFAAYDKNLVITDAQLTAKDTMTEAQIQDFLVAKGSFLADYTVPAARTVTYYVSDTKQITTYENTVIGPYGVSTEVDVTGWKASKVIWQVSQWYGVNPQVVLTIIQKESSFVQRSDGSIAVPGSNDYATYAWMMGYAYTEDTTNPAKNVCGVATPGANPTKSCAGLAAQLDNGTWAIANWMNLANAHSSGSNYSCPSGWSGSYWTNYATRLCDGDWVTPGSGATAALYRYTPHTGLTGGYAGAKAFYLIYNNWFVFSATEQLIYSLSVTSPLVLSNDNDLTPAIGEKISAGFVVTNYNDTAVTLSRIGVAARDIAGRNIDLGWTGPVTLAAHGQTGDYIHFNTPDSLQLATGTNTAWVSACYGGNFYALSSRENYTTSLSFTTHIPKIAATTVISWTPQTILSGQSTTYQTTVKNNEPNRIYFSHLGIAARNVATDKNSDLGYIKDVYIEPGESKVISFTQSLNSGQYYAWTTIHIGDNFYEIRDGANVNHAYLSVMPISSKLLVTSGMQLSNKTPSIGEEVSINYSIKNLTPNDVTFEYIGVANRDSNYKNCDYSWTTNLTIEAGASYSVIAKEKISGSVDDYYAWAAYKINGSWYAALPQNSTAATSLSFTTHIPKIAATTVISWTPQTILSGQSTTYQTTVKNNEPNRIYFSHLGIAARNVATDKNSDLGYIKDVYIEPGESKVISFTQSLNSGQYYAWTTIHIGDNFYEIRDGANVNHAYLSVK